MQWLWPYTQHDKVVYFTIRSQFLARKIRHEGYNTKNIYKYSHNRVINLYQYSLTLTKK
jgi:hypothetical protein